MGLISKLYVKSLLGRYNKEAGIPYYSHQDFNGLHQEAMTFKNSKSLGISYYFYYYDNYKTDKLILFLHGIGPGHTAYLAEIEQLAKRGYKVLTLDYEGCESSEGKNIGSLTNPTKNVVELLDYLEIDKPIIVVGHSLGGFTALNIVHLRDEIKTAVIMSGFLSVESLVRTSVKSKFVCNRILQYERKASPEYFELDNLKYLETTDNRILFIQSEDDKVVPFSIALNVVEKIQNNNIKKIKVQNRKHNPNYTDEAVAYMNSVMGTFSNLKKQHKIKTEEDAINYFKDVSLAKLVQQDEQMFDQICEFIEKRF